MGGDGWRAVANYLRMLTVTRATHPALTLKDDCWQTDALQLPAYPNSPTTSAQRQHATQNAA